MAEEKVIVKTAFPGLQAAAGVKPEDMEVVGDAAKNEPASEAISAPVDNDTPKPEDESPVVAPVESPKNFNVDDLSDEEVNKLIEKRTGGKVKSLADIVPQEQKTKEQLEEESRQRQQEALAWAFESGKVKKEDYESAIILKSKTARELALSAFTASVQEEDSSITDLEAEEMFRDTYHEGHEENSFLYKRGQKEIAKLADTILRDKISVIDEIGPEYEQYTQTQNQYKSFKKQVKKIAEEVSQSFDFEFEHPNLDGSPNKHKVSAALDKKALDKIVSDITSERSFVVRNLDSNGKIDEKALALEISHHLKAKMFDTVIPELLKTNARDVEDRIVVQLGQKRNPHQDLNGGGQPSAGAVPKQNQYNSLNQAMSKQRF